MADVTSTNGLIEGWPVIVLQRRRHQACDRCHRVQLANIGWVNLGAVIFIGGRPQQHAHVRLLRVAVLYTYPLIDYFLRLLEPPASGLFGL